MANIIRVLIVDDSAFVRKLLRQVLSRSPFIEVVGVARDGLEALELVDHLNPDVVTLDLNMPGADGLTFLKTQMAKKPLPIVVVTMASKDGQQVLEALENGAVDMVQKPTGLANDRLLEIADELVLKVKTAAAARIHSTIVDTASTLRKAFPLTPKNTGVDLIVIGISTGGPQALKYLIPRLPAEFPVPIAIALHMPMGYTELFAHSLNEASELEVVEAQEGIAIQPGRVIIAQAGMHLKFMRDAVGTAVGRLDFQPIDVPHRPAVDVLFESAAATFGKRVVGVIMTGMGSDGTKGAACIKSRGGRVFAEAEESCVVYGMPRSVVEAGLCDKTVPLGKMAAALWEAL